MVQAGRPRDDALDRAILDRTAEVLMTEGVEAVNFSRIAELAGTTRPALYRRYRGPEELSVAALHHIASGTRPERTGDHLADLEAELRSFRDGITGARSIALVGTMLTPAAGDELRTTYRELLVRPRRERIRAILDAAHREGALDATPTDLDVATTMCTGSFYAFSLAGVDPPRDWPRRTARLVWRAAGGAVTR
jgi:AcrR family transcriptional regulator